MKILISSKYITFPVNINTSAKKVLIRDGDTLMYDLDCKIDMVSPNFTAYVDVSRFEGKILDISVSPRMDFSVGFSDSMNIPGLYKEEYRPKIHFTVKNGWNNDPNGLVLIDGVYHMFFQYNPCSTEWGNMHWGHAVSKDLIHWEEKDIALYPDKLGTMYSGCAIEDKDNITGFGEGGKPLMLVYYTACGPRCLLSEAKTSSQCLAYSTDGGKTLTKYEKNPILPTITPSNRDPKVVYVQEIGKYVMALYLEGSRYCLLSSNDLVNFEMMHDVFIEGDSECPDIYSLTCDGEKKWVISGASDMYTVGHFCGNRFVADSKVKRLTYSRVSYAAQSYSGIENRVVRASWNRIKIPEAGFSQQMGVFTEMSLRKADGEYYLSSLPISEYESMRAASFSHTGTLVEPVCFDVDTPALDIMLKAEYRGESVLTLDIFGEKLTVDMKNNLLRFKELKMPISLLKDNVDIRIITDSASVEVFADGGIYSGCVMNLYDRNLMRVILSENGEVGDVNFECHTLKSIYCK